MQIKSANNAESTDDAQEKSAPSYELEFAPNSKSVNSKFGAHFGWPRKQDNERKAGDTLFL